jgi:hypothetical protein
MNGKAILAFCAFFLGLGCKQDQPRPLLPSAAPPARSAQEMLDPALPPGHPPIPSQAPVGNMPSLPSPPPPTGADALAWALPKGWTEARAGGMRLATLKPPVAGKVDVSVIMIPGAAGGELANVNRWRGQIGLPPVDESVRAQMRKEVKSKAGAVSLYDFAGEGAGKQRMLAGLLLVDGRSWFVKMVGDDEPVVASRADFAKLLESLHFPAGK